MLVLACVPKFFAHAARQFTAAGGFVKSNSVLIDYTPAAEADRVASLPGWGAVQGLYAG